MLHVVMKVLPHASAKTETKRLKGFKFRTFYWSFSSAKKETKSLKVSNFALFYWSFSSAKKETKRLKSFQFRTFYWSFSSDMMAAKGLTFSTHLVLMEVRMIKPRETFTDTKQVPVQTLYPSEIYFSIRKCLQWDYRLSPRGWRSVGKMGWIGAGVGGRMEGGAVRVGMRGVESGGGGTEEGGGWREGML